MTEDSPVPGVRVRQGGRRRFLLCAVLGALIAVVAGCNSRPAFDFDELDLTPAHDELAEFPLGSFTVPIPVVEGRGRDQQVRSNRLEFGFKLFALITPDQQSSLADAWKRHEGKIRDRVIRVCRNASVADLQEPELATLKSHLADAVQAELGAKGVRRLLLTEVITQEL
jgi:hypothetical protein